MATGYYIQSDEQDKKSPFRTGLLLLMGLALAASLLVGLYITFNQQKADQTIQGYLAAVAEGDYDQAVDLYRTVQEKALTAGISQKQQNLYQSALDTIEGDVDQRLSEIENTINQAVSPDAKQLAFAEGMAELSGVRLIAYIRERCQAYLTGTISLTQLQPVLDNLLALSNVQPTLGDLGQQVTGMTAAIPAVSAAEQLTLSQSWHDAYAAWENLAGTADMVRFVQDFALQRQDQCRKDMYQPLLEQAQQAMTGGRYVTAQTRLLAMQTIFTDDATISGLLAECQEKVPAKIVAWTGQIEQLTVKPLIVNPAQAFDQDSYAAAANDSMLTVSEFAALLQQLYDRQYILIDATRLVNEAGQAQSVQIPEGKKPLILLIEGLNYYATRRQTGNCWNLVLNEAGQVCGTYPDANGQMVVDRRGEAVGILDEFVEQHADFSFDGAKGTISLTGYECIFGYITDQDQLDDRNQALTDNGMTAEQFSAAEIATQKTQAQAVIDRLKQTGWIFASSTYGFIDMNNQDLARIKQDTEKWLTQVGALTGAVRILHYPNGSFLSGSDERCIYLKSQGFRLFGGLGTTPYQFNGDDYVYMDKTPINGYTLRNPATYQLDRLFDVNQVYAAADRP